MKDRFRSKLYTKEIRVFRNHHHCLIESDDGTLFSGHHRTKILEQDLPEWYVYGRYHKCWGYMSTKGITDLLYDPNKFVNHFLKDDCLYISFGGKIEETTPPEDGSYYEKYTGYDERVWGPEIIDILQGAQRYSNYDISGIIQQIKDKKEWLINKYPDEFGPDRWSFDVDKRFAEPLDNRHLQRMFAITLDDYFTPSFASNIKRYYGTLDDIKGFVDALDYNKHIATVDAFREFMEGNAAATHNVANLEHILLEPVTVIKRAFLYLVNEEREFSNVRGSVYNMRVKSAHMNTFLIKDREQYIRCIRPEIDGLCYRSELMDKDQWNPVQNMWGQPGIFEFDKKRTGVFRSTLYLPEKRYDDVKLAVAGLDSEKASLDIVCEDIFADG